MKYGYRFADWSLYDIDEISDVKEMESDYVYQDALSRCNFSKEDYYWVKCSRPIFMRAKVVNGKLVFDKEYEGPYRKEYIFDTYEEADAYGRENSGLRLY